MILVALLIGIVLIVASIRNSQQALFSALGQDVPGFIVWGAAVFAVGALGFIPGLKPISRGLIALVLVVIILNNYQNILSGFQTVASNTSPGSTASSATSTSAAQGSTALGSSSTSSSDPLSLLMDELNREQGLLGLPS